MALERKDRVKDQTSTTGTGTITVSGVAPTGYRTITSAHTDGATVHYLIISSDNTQWEVGEGTWTATGGYLSRDTVHASSNSNTHVSFSAGTKVVITGPTAHDFEWLKILSSDITYYVRTDGNDNNSGLIDSSGGAFLTVQKAVDQAVKFITSPNSQNTVYITIGNGTFGDIFMFGGHVAVQFTGNGYANTTVGNIEVQDWVCQVKIYDVYVKDALYSTGKTTDVLIDACKIATVDINNRSYVRVTNPTFVDHSSSSSADRGINVADYGHGYVGGTIDFSSGPTYNIAFIEIYSGGALECSLNNVTGSYTGKKYKVQNGNLYFVNGSESDLPGTIADIYQGARVGSSSHSTVFYRDYGTVSGGTASVFSEKAPHQRIEASGNHTLDISWSPVSGPLASESLLLELVNYGSYTITMPTVNYINPDGTTTTSISTYFTNLAAVGGPSGFQASGITWMLFWTRDSGTTVYAKVL